MRNMETRFKDFMEEMKKNNSVENIDKLKENPNNPSVKKADYLGFNRSVVFELKTITIAKQEKMKSILKSANPEGLYFSDTNVFKAIGRLDNHSGPKQKANNKLTNTIEDYFKDANKQILGSNIEHADGNAKYGVLIILNPVDPLISPALIDETCKRRLFEKSSKNNSEYRFQNITSVLFISSVHHYTNDLINLNPCTIHVVEGPNSDKKIDELINYLCYSFAAFLGHHIKAPTSGDVLYTKHPWEINPLKGQTDYLRSLSFITKFLT